MELRSDDLPFQYSERDTQFYALSVGMAQSDPLAEPELAFVVEGYPLRVVPTQAVVAARQRLIFGIGLDEPKLLHGGQRLVLHRPMPAVASLLADTRITRVVDKGPATGLILYVENRVRDAQSGEPLFTWTMVAVARGNGGIGAPPDPGDPKVAMPERKPDVVSRFRTTPNQALYYRLNGDRNMLHARPDFAARAGFKAPILHGLCTYGIACREVLKNVCDYAPERIGTFDVRFSAPVYPGEEIETEVWKEAGDVVLFRCHVRARNAVVLDQGRSELRP
jgi:acyl dehydratase